MRGIQEASAVEAELAEARALLGTLAEGEARLLEAEILMMAVVAEAARLQTSAERVSSGSRLLPRRPGRLTAPSMRLSLMHALLPRESRIFGRRRFLLMKIKLMNQHRLIKSLSNIISGPDNYKDPGPGTRVTFLGEQSRRYRS